MLTVELLATIMALEAAPLDGAQPALAVGHVALNKMDAGQSLDQVLADFHAIEPDAEGQLPLAPGNVFKLASGLHVLWKEGAREDFTNGCMFILSHQDLKRLWGEHWVEIAMNADWTSETMICKALVYRLYAFKEWPQPCGECETAQRVRDILATDG
jgi:hypothetical protein